MLYNQLRPLASQHRLVELLSHLDRAIAHDLHTRGLENHWSSSGRRPVYNTRLAELDETADQLIGGMCDVAKGRTRGLPASDSVVQAAQRFIAEIFPNGLQAVVSLPMSIRLLRCRSC